VQGVEPIAASGYKQSLFSVPVPRELQASALVLSLEPAVGGGSPAGRVDLVLRFGHHRGARTYTVTLWAAGPSPGLVLPFIGTSLEVTAYLPQLGSPADLGSVPSGVSLVWEMIPWPADLQRTPYRCLVWRTLAASQTALVVPCPALQAWTDILLVEVQDSSAGALVLTLETVEAGAYRQQLGSFTAPFSQQPKTIYQGSKLWYQTALATGTVTLRVMERVVLP
jgi:hypothetical protein